MQMTNISSQITDECKLRPGFWKDLIMTILKSQEVNIRTCVTKIEKQIAGYCIKP